MKKTSRKLVLRSQTLRVLAVSDLPRAVGGFDSGNGQCQAAAVDSGAAACTTTLAAAATAACH